MVTRASAVDDRTIPQISTLSPEAQAEDIVEGLKGKLSHRECAIRLGVSAVKAQEFARQLAQPLSEAQMTRLVKSIRKHEQIYKLVLGARQVKAGARLERVAKDLGVSNRTLYRYLETV